MKGFYAVVVTSVLGHGVWAASPKLNQYASLDDCRNDRNIISHASPPLWSCHTIDARTQAVYLVPGDTGYYFIGSDDRAPHLANGQCIAISRSNGDKICKSSAGGKRAVPWSS